MTMGGRGPPPPKFDIKCLPCDKEMRCIRRHSTIFLTIGTVTMIIGISSLEHVQVLYYLSSWLCLD